MLAEEFSQLADDYWVDSGMAATFALPQTLLHGVVAQTVEALRVVEIKVVPADLGLDTEEMLDATQLRHRVLDQLVAVHHEDLLARESFKPAVHVVVVERDSDRPVRFVHGAVCFHRQLLEAAYRLVIVCQGVIDVRRGGRRRMNSQLSVI